MDINDAYNFMESTQNLQVKNGGELACFDLFYRWDLDKVGLIDKHDALLIIRQVLGFRSRPKIYNNKYFKHVKRAKKILHLHKYPKKQEKYKEQYEQFCILGGVWKQENELSIQEQVNEAKKRKRITKFIKKWKYGRQRLI